MFFKWNCPITRHIYGWYFGRTQFRKFIFPAIKNFDYKGFSEEIMSIQPMSEPKDQVFYVDYVYTKKKRWYQFWKKSPIKNRQLDNE